MEGKISKLVMIILVLSSCCQWGKYQGAGNDTARNTPDASTISSDSNNHWKRKADLGGVGRYSAVGCSVGIKGYIGTGTDKTDNTHNLGHTNIKDFR